MTINGTAIEDRIGSQDQLASQPFSGPVFVTGVWRSGTSLLYALLNQHPDLGLFYEGDLPVLRPVFRLGYSRKNWVRRWEYWNAGVSRHGLDERRLPASVTSLAEAAEAAGREYCRKKGARIWGCKSPSYYDRLVELAHDFPEARFVVIWRDPEEICRSVMDAATHSRWFAGSGRLHRAILASEVLKKQCDDLVSLGVPVHQLCYKDLVANTAETVRGVCEFLNVPFVPAVTTLEGADRSAVFGGAHHSMVKGKQIAARERKDILPPPIREKIRQYKALWRNESGAESLFSRSFGEVSEATPGKWQRFTDRLRFSILSLKDEAPRIAYSLLPVWTWQAYRAIKYRDLTYLKYHNRLFIDEPTPKKQAGYIPDRQDT